MFRVREESYLTFYIFALPYDTRNYLYVSFLSCFNSSFLILNGSPESSPSMYIAVHCKCTSVLEYVNQGYRAQIDGGDVRAPSNILSSRCYVFVSVAQSVVHDNLFFIAPDNLSIYWTSVHFRSSFFYIYTATA